MPNDAIYGNWKLLAVKWVFSDNGEVMVPFGDTPVGYIAITRDDRLTTVITAQDRSPNAGETPEAAMIRTMFAYSGALRIEGSRFIATVDAAWHPDYVGTEQVRNFEIDGDRLTIATSETILPAVPDRLAVAYLEWTRAAKG
ncbi:lipocalin-like domain-containing protein [Oceanicola sp. 22II-s10i]|uniref:lipocalin-like domain-containing protein n=1 Tax=Oceanicola sp. 22II-s10i TaxID=1317116 RepID=UPI000B528D8C|nr:lipocalin-like domain-containing protein [Oceanicola sp. 22II-s10i]